MSFPLEDPIFFGGGTIEEDRPYDYGEQPPQRRPSRVRQPSQSSLVNGILRRKQVSLDLMSPQAAAFFAEEESLGLVDDGTSVEEEEMPNLIFPLKFAPRVGGPKKLDEKGGIIEAKAPPVLPATRGDKIKAAVLFLLLSGFVGVCVGWKTHSSDKHSFFGVLGTACVTEVRWETDGVRCKIIVFILYSDAFC